MSLDSIYANSLWWVQFRLQGGWRRHLGTVAVYAAAVATLSALMTRAGTGISTGRLAGMWLTALPVLHGCMLLMFGCSTIRRAVQRDFATGMIESHRLAPISGLTATLGYLIGPNLQALVLFCCGWATGIVFCAWGGMPLWDWCVTMAMLLWTALVLWSILGVLALSTAGSVNLLMVGLLGGFPIVKLVLPTVPGIGMLMGLPYWHIGPPTGLQAVLEDTALLPLFLQAAILATCMAATARKFRRSDIRAFSVGLGLLLVLEVALLGALGILNQSTFPAFDEWTVVEPRSQMTATILATMLFLFIPVSVAAQAAAARMARDPKRFRRLQLVGVCLAGTVIITGVSWLLLSNWAAVRLAANSRTWALTGVFVILGILPGAAVLQLLHRWRERVVWVFTAWLFVTWVLPPTIRLTLVLLMDVPVRSSFAWISGFSPAGALTMVWQGSPGALWPGIAVQASLSLVLWAVAAWPRPADVDRESAPASDRVHP